MRLDAQSSWVALVSKKQGIVPQFWAGCSSVDDSSGTGIDYLGQSDQGRLSVSGGGMLWPISWSWSSVACREDWSMLREA